MTGAPLGTAAAIGGVDAGRDPGAVAGHELFTREARRDGRLVVELRCSRRGEGFVVECDTFNVAGPADASPKRRAFAFRDRPSAERFVTETLRAVEYLGCRAS